MVLTFSVVLLGLLALFRPLQKNPFYVLHSAIIILSAYYVETHFFKTTPFHPKTFLLLIVFDFISISLVTFLAYYFDKRAAQKGAWRVSESNLHTLELLGGWSAAFVAQKFFNHKTKKKAYQSTFWFIFITQVTIIVLVLKFLKII